MIDIITPSGDRPLQFSLCKEWMKKQDFTDKVHWIVADDSVHGYYDTSGMPDNWEITHLKIKRDSEPKSSTQAENLLLALNHIKYDKIAMIEDDDYYASDWLSLCSTVLNNFNMFGIKNLLYYNMSNRTWVYKKYRNTNNDSNPMYSTAFNKKFVEALKYICKENTDRLDNLLWLQKDSYYLMDCNIPSAIGIKGLPGRPSMNMGAKHRSSLGNDDQNFNMLKTFIGEYSFSKYKETFNDLFKEI